MEDAVGLFGVIEGPDSRGDLLDEGAVAVHGGKDIYTVWGLSVLLLFFSFFLFLPLSRRSTFFSLSLFFPFPAPFGSEGRKEPVNEFDVY